MDCRYCALQGYFNRPVMELFVNIDDLFKELDLYLNEDHLTFHRICTGEFTDSLALEPLTGMATRLVTFFSGIKNASLEIKTKTDFVAPLLEVDHQGRVVLSFSVNSTKISRNDKKRSAPLEQRLAAAASAQDSGYAVGFHFDPIIPFLGWEYEYFETIDKIFRHLRSASVAWISLGVLRFVPELKEVAEARFGTLPYFHDGFLRGLDGKMRLHVDRRIEIYHRIAERIRRHAPRARIYLCMESPNVWRESLDIDMETNEEFAAYLDEAVK
jgi:spore photoproduct lyase